VGIKSWAAEKVTYLALVRGPLAISVPVEHNLIAARIPHFGSSVRERPIGGPLDVVAGRLLDQEGLGAALVAVLVEALFDGIVEDGARDDLGGCSSAFVLWYISRHTVRSIGQVAKGKTGQG
jgi:hypothetical protein